MSEEYVRWFRRSAPYINAHRGRTFVISVGGEALADAGFGDLIHDVALLHSLGIRVVLVAGTRPQIEQRLTGRGATMRYHAGLRVTDDTALACVKEAAGSVRVEIEALLSMGVANSPMAGFRLRVASGNFVTARPLGVRDGVDYLHTGEVRRIDAEAIGERLNAGCIVLLAPLGYSPTGEVFNLAAEEVALAAAQALRADKLIYLAEGPLPRDSSGELIRELDLHQTLRLVDRATGTGPEEEQLRLLEGAVRACRTGVERVHLLERRGSGHLLLELFTRDGVGTLVTGNPFELIRVARAEDVSGILELIEPLERDGVLVERSREHLETRVAEFSVIERDGAIIASAALSPHPESAMGELSCFAIHGDYRRGGRGEQLLRHVEKQARRQELSALFVLTTRASHWFRERGFRPASLDDLPVERRALYNLKRNSKVFIKPLG